jgi:hypothetical protein
MPPDTVKEEGLKVLFNHRRSKSKPETLFLSLEGREEIPLSDHPSTSSG